jgi:hypothetical protein
VLSHRIRWSSSGLLLHTARRGICTAVAPAAEAAPARRLALAGALVELGVLTARGAAAAQDRLLPLRPERAEDGSTSPICMGSDGIAIAADGNRLYWCPLAGWRWYSGSVDALSDRSIDDDAVVAAVTDEGDEGCVSDGLETDDQGAGCP